MHNQTLAASAFVFDGSNLGEAYVLALTLLVAFVSVVLLRLRLSLTAIRKIFIVATVACFVTLTAIAAVRFELYREIYREHGLLEWLTVDLLLAACVIGLIVAVRLARRGRPSPICTFLTFGYFVAFMRELEWGSPFYGGERLWRRRHLINPRAYFDVSYFEKFSRKLDNLYPPETLYAVHLIIAGLLILLGAIAVVYILRHRRVFMKQLRSLARASYGRYFFLGLAGYLGAHTLGKIIHWVRKAMGVTDFPHRLIEEPIELWGAMAFFFSMLAMWITARNKKQEGPAITPP